MKLFLSLILLLCGFITLITLGVWQVQRLDWKNDIIIQLDQQYALDPLKNKLSFNALSTPLEGVTIHYGSVKGRFDYTKEILVSPIIIGDDLGADVITPMTLDSGGHVLVNRGWIAQDKIEANLAASHIKGEVVVSGLFKTPPHNKYTVRNSPQNNVWNNINVEDVTGFFSITKMAPLVLYADNSVPDFKTLQPYQEKWYPRNKHLQYAIFWFTMAGALLSVFGLYAWRFHSPKAQRRS